MYSVSNGGVLENNKAGNGTRIYWECCSFDKEKASVRRGYLSEDLQEVRGQVTCTSRGVQQETGSVKVPRWK